MGRIMLATSASTDEEYGGTTGIAQSGSNANGRYIKYADGTMICTKTVTHTGAILTAWGNLYESSPVNLGSFAQEFAEIPNISVTPQNGDGAWMEGVRQVTTTSAGITNFLRPNSDADSKTRNVSVIAVGRWQ
jgi:hypothetical protein